MKGNVQDQGIDIGNAGEKQQATREQGVNY